MSRVEELSVPRDFPESGIEPYKDMVARLGRRTGGRIRWETEIKKLMEGIIVLEEGAIEEREYPRRAKKTKIVSSYPLGWTKIKRW